MGTVDYIFFAALRIQIRRETFCKCYTSTLLLSLHNIKSLIQTNKASDYHTALAASLSQYLLMFYNFTPLQFFNYQTVTVTNQNLEPGVTGKCDNVTEQAAGGGRAADWRPLHSFSVFWEDRETSRVPAAFLVRQQSRTVHCAGAGLHLSTCLSL